MGRNSGYFLGLSGWPARSHDASACLVKNGEIIVMAEEERFLRKKHAYDKPPILSTLWCLKKAGIELDDVEGVGIGWDYQKLYRLGRIDNLRPGNPIEIFFPRKYFKYSRKPAVEFVPHHLAHAASSFFVSGLERASILIVDGQGENESATLAYGEGTTIKILSIVPVSCSLGYFYEAVSDFIGLGLDSAGKTMGLAPYGSAKYEFDQFVLQRSGYKLSFIIPWQMGVLDQQMQVVGEWKKQLEKMFGKPNIPRSDFREEWGDIHKEVKLSKLHKDIAASAQSTLERVILHLVNSLIQKTKEKNLCFTGGVALNCSTNSLIYNSGLVDDLFIPPMANDGGVSMGAALYVSKTKSKHRLTSACFGPEFTNSQIRKTLDRVGIGYTEVDDISAEVSKMLAEGKIVSWFQGRMEVGPRALGARSILANPTRADTHIKVNNAKGRELWRPLAPSFIEGKMGNYLEGSFASPFMLHTFQVREEKRKEIPAVVHVDGSTRPQSVAREANSKYYGVIEEFMKITGVPAVLNTSFNGANEPIVCTPSDALVSFFLNSTEFLAMGDFLVKKC